MTTLLKNIFIVVLTFAVTGTAGLTSAEAKGMCPSVSGSHKVPEWDRDKAPRTPRDIVVWYNKKLSKIQNNPAFAEFIASALELSRPYKDLSESKKLNELDVSGLQIDFPGAAWAVAEMISKRTEAELRQFVIGRVMTGICKNGKEYFPNVCSINQNYALGMAPSQKALVRAVRADLDSLPACLIWNNAEPHPMWGYFVIDAVKSIKKGQAPLPTLAGLAETDLKSQCEQGVLGDCGAYLVGTLTQATLSVPLLNISRKDRGSFFLMYVYAKLLEGSQEEQQLELLKSISVSKENLQLYLEQVGLVVERMQTKAVVLSDLVAQLEKAAREAGKDKDKEREAIEISVKISETILSLLEDQSEVFVNIPKQKIKNIVEQVHDIAKTATYVETKRYSEAIGEFTTILTCIGDREPAMDASACGPWEDFKINNAGILKSLKYFPILDNIAMSNTPEELKTALDMAASPVGAWRVKREANFTTSLGALVGISGGYENLHGKGISTEGGFFSGMMASLGIDFSWHIQGDHTPGVFLSAVDFGNLMSVRLTDDSVFKVKKEANVDFAQILSPGIFFRWGFGNTPWVAGGGLTLTPGLRSAELPSGETIKLDSLRYLLFVAMDITLLPF